MIIKPEKIMITMYRCPKLHEWVASIDCFECRHFNNRNNNNGIECFYGDDK